MCFTEALLEAQGHLGLGLSIARKIIQSMKGTIQA
ncbi:ATP-binding protein [Paenibacillus sp. FSL K6-1096]